MFKYKIAYYFGAIADKRIEFNKFNINLLRNSVSRFSLKKYLIIYKLKYFFMKSSRLYLLSKISQFIIDLIMICIHYALKKIILYSKKFFFFSYNFLSIIGDFFFFLKYIYSYYLKCNRSINLNIKILKKLTILTNLRKIRSYKKYYNNKFLKNRQYFKLYNKILMNNKYFIILNSLMRNRGLSLCIKKTQVIRPYYSQFFLRRFIFLRLMNLFFF